MNETRVTIGTGGRINLPAVHRRALGFEEGSEVILAVEGDSLRISSRRAAIRRAREIIGRYVPADVSLVGELSADRRREAEAAGAVIGAVNLLEVVAKLSERGVPLPRRSAPWRSRWSPSTKTSPTWPAR